LFITQEVITAEQVENGYDATLQTQQQPVNNNDLSGSQLTDDAAETREAAYDSVDNEAATGSQSTFEELISTDAVWSEVISGDVNVDTELSYENEAGASTDEAQEFVQNHTEAQSTVSNQFFKGQETSKEPEYLLSMTGNAYSEECNVQPQDQSLDVSSGQYETTNFYQEEQTKERISTGTASVGDVDTTDAAAPAEDDLLCMEVGRMTSPLKQQPEIQSQSDPAVITSPEPEVAINSDEAPTSPCAQQLGMGETQISTLPTPEIDSEQRKMEVEADVQSEVQSSLFATGHETPVIDTSEQSHGSTGNLCTTKTSEDQPLEGPERQVQALVDESSTISEGPTNGVEHTLAPSFDNMVDSCSEKVISVDENAPTHTGERQSLPASDPPTALDQSEQCDEPPKRPPSDRELRHGVPPQPTDIGSASKPDAEPPIFMFPEPPRHLYEPLAVGDESADDVFVEHSSSTRNDSTKKPMTSSAVVAAEVGRQQQPRCDEMLLADAASEQLQLEPEEALIADGGRSFEAAHLQPASEAAAAAPAPAAAADSEQPAANGSHEVLVDESGSIEASTIDELKTSSSSSSSSSLKPPFPIATDAVYQQLDETAEQQSSPQKSGRADRHQLSLLIPEHDSDSDVHSSSNEVGVYAQS